MTTKIDGTTGVDNIQPNTVQTADIADSAVTASKLSGAQTGTAPIYGARAWCIFDGTLTGTITPTASGNVTSITKNATGDYTVNFTSPLPDANYAAVAMAGLTSGTIAYKQKDATARTTTTFPLYIFQSANGAAIDMAYIAVVIFR
jgi:hypothetical protein